MTPRGRNSGNNEDVGNIVILECYGPAEVDISDDGRFQLFATEGFALKLVTQAAIPTSQEVVAGSEVERHTDATPVSGRSGFFISLLGHVLAIIIGYGVYDNLDKIPVLIDVLSRLLGCL